MAHSCENFRCIMYVYISRYISSQIFVLKFPDIQQFSENKWHTTNVFPCCYSLWQPNVNSFRPMQTRKSNYLEWERNCWIKYNTLHCPNKTCVWIFLQDIHLRVFIFQRCHFKIILNYICRRYISFNTQLRLFGNEEA